MSGIKTSHDYARRLQEQAAFLLGKPEFKTESSPHAFFWYYGDKEGFLGAVKAVGSGKKEFTNDEVKFRPVGFPEITIYANRNSVCKKVQEAVWECEPLLSAAEEEQIEEVSDVI